MLLGALLWSSLRYARRAGVLGDTFTPALVDASERRIVRYQQLYAVAVLTSVVSTYLAIGLLVLLQVDSVVSPRVRALRRLTWIEAPAERPAARKRS